MPRFYFHLWDGRSLRRDRRGTFFPTLSDAVAAAGTVVKNAQPQGADLSGHVVQVAGQKGWLAIVPLEPSDGSAKAGRRRSRPDGDVDGEGRRPGQSAAAVRPTLARHFEGAMTRKGWSIGETARQASQFLADGQRFGRAQIWHYVRGAAVPRSHHLEALVRALELDPSSIRVLTGSGAGPASSPATDARPGRSETPFLEASDAGQGNAFLNIRAEVPWPTALEVLEQIGSVLER